ncbi:MAG: lactonase family protein [Lentisphaeria bacterium]|jgi:6-phosphogluconolactonase (cycloisomerase 2 family)
MRAMGILLVSCTALAPVLAQQFYVVAAANSDAGGVYRLGLAADGTFEQYSFTAVKTINYLIRHPLQPDYYYGTVERLPDGTRGGVVAFRRVANGDLEPLTITPTGGASSCHLVLSPDGNFLYTANYGGASISELPMRDFLPQPGRVIAHHGSGPHKRQAGPHPHFVGFDPAGKQLFVPDLGLDRVLVYPWQAGVGLLTDQVEQLSLAPGAGPRHAVFTADGNTLYVANELDGSVTSFVRREGCWLRAHTIPAVHAEDIGTNYPGAIRLSADERWLLVSNRGHNSLALLATGAGGAMTLRDVAPSGGVNPRDLMICPSGDWLLTTNDKSGTLARLRFDTTAGRLELLETTLALPVAQAVLFCE